MEWSQYKKLGLDTIPNIHEPDWQACEFDDLAARRAEEAADERYSALINGPEGSHASRPPRAPGVPTGQIIEYSG